MPTTKRWPPPLSAFAPGGASSGGSWTSGARCTRGSSQAGIGAGLRAWLGPSARPRAGLGAHVASLEQLAAARADAVLAELTAAALVAQHDRRPCGGDGVTVAPAKQLDDHGPQVEALRRQTVFVAQRALLVGDLFEDPLGHQPVQARGEDVTRDAEALPHLVEAPPAEEHIAQHEDRPTLANELERTGDRAVLVLVVAPQHLATSYHLVAS